jgi:hypothetical protein
MRQISFEMRFKATFPALSMPLLNYVCFLHLTVWSNTPVRNREILLRKVIFLQIIARTAAIHHQKI